MNSHTVTSKQLRAQSVWIAAIGEPTRLALIRALAIGEKTVTELAKLVKSAVVNVSQHLSILKAVGLATVERDGRHMRYNLVGATATSVEMVLTHESGARVFIALN